MSDRALSRVVFFPDPGLYQFGEGFCGARAPLTWAHCCEGNPVIAPFDKMFNPDGDFFAESGKELLRTFESETALMEHWGQGEGETYPAK